jgi:methionyl-tRNA formyltransferase
VVGAETLLGALPPFLNGALEPQPQDPERATKAPLLRKEDGLLIPTVPAADLALRARAYQPWPGAYLRCAGTTLKVLRAHAESASIPPGTRTVIDGYPAWGTVEGALVLDEVQPAGKKPMRGADFLLGARHWLS